MVRDAVTQKATEPHRRVTLAAGAPALAQRQGVLATPSGCWLGRPVVVSGPGTLQAAAQTPFLAREVVLVRGSVEA